MTTPRKLTALEGRVLAAVAAGASPYQGAYRAHRWPRFITAALRRLQQRGLIVYAADGTRSVNTSPAKKPE